MMEAQNFAIDSQKTNVRVINDRLGKIYRRLSRVTVSVPLVGTLLAISLLWNTPLGWVEIGLLVGMYALTIFGIEVGFHRYFTHRAFQTKKFVRVVLAILGSMAAQGGVIFWVAHHRCHHQYADRPNDPHSPNLHGDSIKARMRGFWHAHVGWVLAGEIPNSLLFAKDLLREPIILKVNQWQHIWVFLGLILPAIVDGAIRLSWMGVLQGFLWGGLVRVFLGQQIINSTNSICHLWGDRPFHSDDCSTNNNWLAIPSWGQSLHNNHHAFPNSANVGLKWWQIDPGYWAIWILKKMGLVWDVKVPTASVLEMKAR